MGLIVPTVMQPEREDQPPPYECFVGIDWGSQQHQVSVLDRDRRRMGERVVDHDGASLAQLVAWLWGLSAGQPQRVAVAIEVPRGAIVEGLVERGFHVWLLLDSRVVDVPRSSNLIVVILSSLKPLFFNGLKKALPFSDNTGA
jgi:hypothetical protein